MFLKCKNFYNEINHIKSNLNVKQKIKDGIIWIGDFYEFGIQIASHVIGQTIWNLNKKVLNVRAMFVPIKN